MSQQALSVGIIQNSAVGNFLKKWQKGQLHGTQQTEAKNL
jgi:hypothetical protein